MENLYHTSFQLLGRTMPLKKFYVFEVGGKNKGHEQIMGLKNAYLALDNLEYGFGNKIPLWMFGMLY